MHEDSPADKDGPRPDVGVSSFQDKAENAWHMGEPADDQRNHRTGATVFTPEGEHNRSGPDSERYPDAPLVPSLIALAATLGITLIDGERMVDAEPADPSDQGYDTPVHVGADVLTDVDQVE